MNVAKHTSIVVVYCYSTMELFYYGIMVLWYYRTMQLYYCTMVTSLHMTLHQDLGAACCALTRASHGRRSRCARGSRPFAVCMIAVFLFAGPYRAAFTIRWGGGGGRDARRCKA